MHDESGTVFKVREEPAPCLITAQRLAERDGHVAANPCTFIPLREAQCAAVGCEASDATVRIGCAAGSA